MKLKVSAVNIGVDELIERFQNYDKFEAMCANCPNYGKNWACPPVFIDRRSYLSRFKNACVFTTQMIFDEEELAAHSGDAQAYKYAQPFVDAIRSAMWRGLSRVESLCGGVMLFGGVCPLCSRCSREDGIACIKPERMRYNMDTFGFDFSKLAEELFGVKLLWSKKGLPEYYAITSLVLTDSTEEYADVLRRAYLEAGYEFV